MEHSVSFLIQTECSCMFVIVHGCVVLVYEHSCSNTIVCVREGTRNSLWTGKADFEAAGSELNKSFRNSRTSLALRGGRYRYYLNDEDAGPWPFDHSI